MVETYITSYADLFLSFIGRERANMAAPEELKFEAKNYFRCINIDGTTTRSLQTNILAHILYVFSTTCLFDRGPLLLAFLCLGAPAGSQLRDGDVAVYVFDVNQPSLPTPFNSVLVSVSFFTALSTVFHSTNSPDSSLFSGSVFPVLLLPYWSFQLYRIDFPIY